MSEAKPAQNKLKNEQLIALYEALKRDKDNIKITGQAKYLPLAAKYENELGFRITEPNIIGVCKMLGIAFKRPEKTQKPSILFAARVEALEAKVAHLEKMLDELTRPVARNNHN